MSAHRLLFAVLFGTLLGCSTPSEDPNIAEPLASCQYINGFSGQDECKEYLGSAWTPEAIAENCSVPVPGSDPGFVLEGVGCEKNPIRGQCFVDAGTVESLTIVFPSLPGEDCDGLSVGCFFAGGEWAPAAECGGVDPVEGSFEPQVFVPFEQVCVDPLPGDPLGRGPKGQVCTWEGISAATEPGRSYSDYASCEPVLTQRPYYAAPTVPETAEDDPRYSDPDWQEEFAWATEQIDATACVCCHKEAASPEAGPSNWFIDSPGIWTDAFSNDGLAAMAGWIDSTAFGAFKAEDNNGFGRTHTAVPTTDTKRMALFFIGELERRGLSQQDFAEATPFGGPLYDQMIYEPSTCSDGLGVDADGRVHWAGGAARYVYVLEADSDSPGVPPNRDLPFGTVWKLDAASLDDNFDSGLRFGEVPEGGQQAWPESGLAAPVLESGSPYYLYVLMDVAAPLTRCLFVAP
jgi:hypothetical protein